MKQLNLVFAGTPLFAKAIFENLIHHSYIPKAFFTQPDRPLGRGQKIAQSEVKSLAIKHNIPVFQPPHLKDSAQQQLLKDLKPDILIVVAYGLILPEAVLSIPTYGCLNVHASLLPRWRGAAPIQHALLAGDKETGITLMQMDKGLDTGDMLLKKVCPILDTDTSISLHDKLIPLGTDALLEILPLFEKNALQNVLQNPLQPVKQEAHLATYAPKISKQDAKIQWQMETASQIEHKIRAYNPFPIAFFDMETKQGEHQSIRVFSAKIIEGETKERPGTLLQASTEGVDVATKLGIVRLLEIQLPGKKPLPIKEVLNAHAAWFTKGKILP